MTWKAKPLLAGYLRFSTIEISKYSSNISVMYMYLKNGN